MSKNKLISAKDDSKNDSSQTGLFNYKHLFDLLILLAITAVALLFVWPVRYLPYHLDAARLINNGALVLTERNFNPPVLLELGISHQPLYMTYLAGLWKMFGDSFTVSHLSMVPFLIIFLMSSYYLFKKICPFRAGFVGHVFVGFFPSDY